MDYTNSANYATHAGTGKRMHEANQALPTVVSDSDVNQLTWELMSVIEGAGMVGQAFNENSPASYQQLLLAIKLLAGGRAVDSGAANAYVLTMTPAPSALVDLLQVTFTVSATNNGASTINLNGLGVKPIKGLAQVALQGGELFAGGKATVIYSASQASWILLECTGGKQQIPDGTQSGHAVSFGQFSGSKGENGYQRLPGGLIVQWGKGTGSSSADFSVTFPIAFTTSAFTVTASCDYTAGSGNIGYVAVAAPTLTGFTARSSGPYSTRWIAFGY